jgi:U3 small nucleolar RNA-associated protein 5
VPNASSLSTVLTQALNSSDEKLLQSCFNPSYDHQTIHNTLVRLSPPLIPSLLNYFNSVLSRKQKRVDSTLAWIREAVVIHGGYLVSQGQEVREVLIQLKGTLDRRGQTWERLVRLKGRLEILRAIKGQSTTAKGREPEVTWVEEDEDVEPEVEDVRYLRDAEEEDGEGMDDIEEVDGADDVLVVNGIGSEDEVDDDESSSDEAIEPIKKVNGIPHMSDSEDSAVDLADLIDDEASEASDEENSDDVSEDDEDDEEEEEEIEDIPPPKKSRSRR